MKYDEELEDWDKFYEVLHESRSEKQKKIKTQRVWKKDYTGKKLKQRIPKMVLVSALPPMS